MDLLATDLATPPVPKTVPNVFPTLTTPYRIAVIGEAPGRDEEIQGEPFVGPSGYLLNQLCSRTGLVRQALFIGNICQHRPPDNEIAKFLWDGPEIQSGLAQLRSDLAVFKPNLCVVLGNSALKAFRGGGKITYWRGAVWHSADWGYKCLATYHPAAVLRQYDLIQVLAFDLRKAAQEGLHTRIDVPERLLITPFSGGNSLSDDTRVVHFHWVMDQLNQALDLGVKLSLDIEGGVLGMSCLSIAKDPGSAFIIPFSTTDGLSYWTEEQEEHIWYKLSKVLNAEHVPKVLQNSLYDNFVLSWTYRTPIVNVTDDTMFKHWEAYCELPKSLGFQASIYTKQPPWKDDIKTPNLQTFWHYCCTDSAVTYEINEKLDGELANEPKSLEHYKFNLAMLNPLLYMELRGIKFNATKRGERCKEVLKEVNRLNDQLTIYNEGEELNVKSTKQKKKFLYETLGLPVRKHRTTGAVTTNDEAILSLFKQTENPALGVLLNCIRARTHWSNLQMDIDPDGRVRCSYNQLSLKDENKGGPPTTGRLSCSTSLTGSGTNLQTITEEDRVLFGPDEGYHMFQCDLSGADGWSVAAHSKRLGDPTMLDDMQAGIKVAKVVASMFTKSPQITKLQRHEIKEVSDQIQKKDPIYFGAKCCQHGTNYGMGKVLLSQTIFLESDGKVNISAADAERLQTLYLLRYYGVRLWHEWCARELKAKGRLTAASGHTRIFFGKRDDHSTVKQFLAHEPQANTTYATNLAALRLWTDPENRWGYWTRREDTWSELRPISEYLQSHPSPHPDALVIEPLHQVHDALLVQAPKELTTWTITKLKSWFNNELEIAGQKVVIPFEGSYGDNWGNLTNKI